MSMIRALPCVVSVMIPAWLPVKLTGLDPVAVDGDGQQRHRDALSRRQQEVQVAGDRDRRDLVGHRQQLVGGVAHRADHDHDVVAALTGLHDAAGHRHDPFRVRDRGSAVFLHDDAHVPSVRARTRGTWSSVSSRLPRTPSRCRGDRSVEHGPVVRGPGPGKPGRPDDLPDALQPADHDQDEDREGHGHERLGLPADRGHQEDAPETDGGEQPGLADQEAGAHREARRHHLERHQDQEHPGGRGQAPSRHGPGVERERVSDHDGGPGHGQPGVRQLAPSAGGQREHDALGDVEDRGEGSPAAAQPASHHHVGVVLAGVAPGRADQAVRAQGAGNQPRRREGARQVAAGHPQGDG